MLSTKIFSFPAQQLPNPVSHTRRPPPSLAALIPTVFFDQSDLWSCVRTRRPSRCAVSAASGSNYCLLRVPVTRGDRAVSQPVRSWAERAPSSRTGRNGYILCQGLAAKITLRMPPNHAQLPPKTYPTPAPGRDGHGGSRGGIGSGWGRERVHSGQGETERRRGVPPRLRIRETEAGAGFPAGFGPPPPRKAPRSGEGEGTGLGAGLKRAGGAVEPRRRRALVPL